MMMVEVKIQSRNVIMFFFVEKDVCSSKKPFSHHFQVSGSKKSKRFQEEERRKVFLFNLLFTKKTFAKFFFMFMEKGSFFCTKK